MNDAVKCGVCVYIERRRRKRRKGKGYVCMYVKQLETEQALWWWITGISRVAFPLLFLHWIYFYLNN